VVFILIFNIIWQHFYCQTPLGYYNPLSISPCEPLEDVIKSRDEYVELSKKYPYEVNYGSKETKEREKSEK
jgi:hypothetical protein